MAESVLIIGGNGQLGRAAATTFARSGWSVTIAHRGQRPQDPKLDQLQIGSIRLDRNDTAALLAAADGHDCVIDTIAFTAAHGQQLVQLAGQTASLVVISSGAVYAGQADPTGRTPPPAEPPAVPIREDARQVSPDGPGYPSQKAALEAVLLDADDLPVSLLRPGTLHGAHSTSLHHWSFIKRALDGRKFVPLAYDGQSRFSTSAALNVAELMRLCALNPGKRVLNAADEQTPTVAELARKVFDAMNYDAAIVTFPGPPREHRVGFNPWGVPDPIVLSMDRAIGELGYQPAIAYDKAIELDIEWAVGAVAEAEAAGGSWHDVFPAVIERYGADGWFPYDAEDDFLLKSARRT